MKIDWKVFSKSEGYKSLKKAALRTSGYSNEKKFNTMGGRGSSDHSRRFKYVIDMVKKASYKTNLKPWIILDTWEGDRDYSFYNYYQEGNEGRLFNMLKPLQDRLVLKAD